MTTNLCGKLELQKAKEEIQKAKEELQSVNHSVSFRVGRAITWTPRKVRGGVRCFRENGIAYTAHRFLEHLTGRAD